MKKNFYAECKKYGVDTYGFDIAAVIKALSADMADKFAKATEDMSKAENRALVQAVYKTYMGMRAVTGGNYKLSDSAIVEMQGLLLVGKE
jgi:hypothetical protein